MLNNKLQSHIRGMRKYWFIICEHHEVENVLSEAKNQYPSMKLKNEANISFLSIDSNKIMKHIKESLVGESRGWKRPAMEPNEADEIINDIIDTTGNMKSCFSNNSSDQNGICSWDSIWENDEEYIFEDAYIIVGSKKTIFLYIVEND